MIGLAVVAVAAALGLSTFMLGLWNPSEKSVLAKYSRPDSQFVDMDGVRIHYSDQGSGPAILLVHGSTESLRTWDGVASHLIDRYRVVRFDVPDNGLSSADPKQRYTVEDDFVRISALMDKLGIDKFVIGGSSWGGTIAYGYAFAHPERVAGLILISTPGARPTNAYFSLIGPVSRFKKWTLKYWISPAQVERTIRGVTANPTFLTPAQMREYQDTANRRGRAREWAERLRQILPAEEEARAQAELAQITAPTLIAWGLNNPAFGPGCADDLEKILVRSPKVKKVIYDNVGHKVEREAPDRLGPDMKAFLAEISFGA